MLTIFIKKNKFFLEFLSKIVSLENLQIQRKRGKKFPIVLYVGEKHVLLIYSCILWHFEQSILWIYEEVSIKIKSLFLLCDCYLPFVKWVFVHYAFILLLSLFFFTCVFCLPLNLQIRKYLALNRYWINTCFRKNKLIFWYSFNSVVLTVLLSPSPFPFCWQISLP